MFLAQIDKLITILLIGSLVLLSFIKLSNPLKINRKGNLYFGVFVAIWSTFWLEEWGDLAGISITPFLLVAIHSSQIFVPLFLYFSIIFYSKPLYRFQTTDIIHLIIPSIFIFLQITRVVFPEYSYSLTIAIAVVILAEALLYSVLSYFRIRQHQKQLLSFASSTQRVNLRWLKYIVVLVLFSTIIALAYNLFIDYRASGIMLNSVNLVSAFLITYFALRQKEIYPVAEAQKNKLEYLEEEETLSKRKLITDEDLKKLKLKLTVLMDTEQVFRDSELNLVKLAEMLEVSPHQLSYTINTGFGVNFFQYINQYRISKAKELLTSKTDAATTMLAIAFDSGFNSKTAFNTTFKKLTGKTPTEYRQKHKTQITS